VVLSLRARALATVQSVKVSQCHARVRSARS
jgi:hypothetical protein